jgi:aspartyl-tRNA(Asn)/glutamyl-tRNA(Gln) amidotransferase subunit A
MSRTVADSAALLSIMAGFDRRDRHSVPAPPADYLKAIDRKLGRCRIAWSPTLGYGRVDAEVRQVAEDAAADLAAALDAELVEIDPPIFDARRHYLALVAASTDLKALRSIARTSRSDLSQGLLETLDHHWRAEDFSDAAMARQDLYDRLRAFMETFRFLVTPTVSVTAFPLGSRSPARIAGLPVRSHREWTPFTFPMSLADLPAASIPAGFDAAGLPVGLQIVGRRFDEAGVLAASAALERVRPWAHSWPAV